MADENGQAKLGPKRQLLLVVIFVDDRALLGTVTAEDINPNQLTLID